MWPDLQVGLIGLIGVVLIGRGMWELLRSWPAQRGKKLAETLVGFAVGLVFAGIAVEIAFFDVPFEPASAEELVLAVLVLLGSLAWRVLTTRRDKKSDP
ncbi:hypothetical protein [Actinomadura sp. K4S16]|uniref:hypothetical protein n=1 Tax=Actinomadura sp. K4S16 TaxID=1316147 RepID=UPI0011EF817D|nr:hypothetical protein [Actinomadura sp. K4S16]